MSFLAHQQRRQADALLRLCYEFANWGLGLAAMPFAVEAAEMPAAACANAADTADAFKRARPVHADFSDRGC